MALTVATNTGALMAQAAASSVNKEMEISMERLSTGKRINSASDDAAGVAMISRMEAQTRGINQAIRNSMDAQSLIDTSEAAQQEVNSVLQRMRELSVQAANDTNTASDRVNLQLEVTQLVAEIDRIATQTTWNGMNVLDGTFSSKYFQVGSDTNQTVSMGIDNIGSSVLGNYQVNSTVQISDVATGGILADDYTLVGPEGSTTISTSAGDSAKEFAADVNALTSSTGITATGVTKVKLDNLSAADTISLTINGTSTSSVAATSTSDLRGVKDAINAISGTTGVTAELHEGSNAALQLVDADGDDISIILVAATNSTEIRASALDRNGAQASSTAGSDDLVVQLVDAGATEAAGDGPKGAAVAFTGQVSLHSYAAFNVQVTNDAADYDEATAGAIVADGEFFGDGDGAAVSTTNATLASVSTVSVSTRSGAITALSIIDGALDSINNQRATLGALSNRLDKTVSNLTSIANNVAASKGRIEDADFAAETTNLAKTQILQQASTAMLAQANASKQNVLSLLQG